MPANPKVKKLKFTWTLNDKGPVIYRNNAGLFHRENGPAVEYEDGTKYWDINGKQHRLDGPAVEYPNGTKYWLVDGKQVTELQCNLLCDMMKLRGLL